MVKYKQNAPDLGDNVLVKYGRYGTEFAAARLVVTEEQRPGSVFIQWVDRGDRAWVAQESVEKMEDLSKGGRRSRRGSRSSSVAPTTWVNQKKIKKEVKKEPKVEFAEKKPQKKAAKATNNNSDKDKKTKVKVESVPKKTQKKKKVSSKGKAKDKGNSSLGLEDTDDEAPREPVVKRTKLKKTTGKKGSSAGNESSAASKETGSILSNETDKDNRSRSTSDKPPFKDRATKQEELTSTDEGAGKTAHSSQGKSIQGNEKRPGRTDALDVEARDKLNDGQEATTTSKSGSNGGSSMKVPRKGQSKSTLEKADSAKAGPPLAQQSRQQLTDGGDPKFPKETPKLPKEVPKLPKEVPQSSASQPAVAAEKLQRSSVAPHPNRTANASTASGAGNKSSVTASAGGDSQSAKSANTDEEVLQTRVSGRAKQPMTNVSTCSTASQQHTAKPKPKTKIIVTLSDDSTDEEEDDAGEASTRVSHSTTNSFTVRNAPVHIAETTKAVPRDPASKKASQNNSAVPAKSPPTTGDQSTSSADRNVLRPKPRKDPNVAHGRPGKQNKVRPEQFTGSLSSARTLEPTRPNPRKAASGRKEHTKTASMVSAGSGASHAAHYRTLTSTASEVAACCDLRVQITRFEDAFIQLHGHPPKGAAERAPLATTYSQYRELKRAIRADAACRIQALFRGARLRWGFMRSDDSKISDIVRRRAGRKEFSGQTAASENESGTTLEESHRASRAAQTTVGINRTAAVVAPPRARTSVSVEEPRKESVIARGNEKATAHGRAAEKAKPSANASVRESKTRDREKPRKEPVVENRTADAAKSNDGNTATRQEPTLCKQESTTSVPEALLASGSTAKLKEPAWISLSERDSEPAAAQSDRPPQAQNADSRVQNPLVAAERRAPPQANEAPATSAQMSKNKAADPVPSLPAQKQSTRGTTAATAPIARPPTAGLVPQAQNADSRVQNPLVATETRTPQANEARATLQKPQVSKSKATDPVQSPPPQKQSTRGTAAATEPSGTGIARPSPPKQPTAAAPTAGLLPQKRSIDETKSTVRAPVACPSTQRHSVDLARAATVPVARPSPPKQMKAMAPKPSTSKQSTANPAATIGKPSQPSMDTAKAAAPIIVRTTSPQQSIAKPSTSKWPTNAANATAAATTALLSPKKRPLQVEDAADAADKASTPAKKRLREDGGAETQTRNTVPSTNQDRTSTQRQEGSTPVRRRRLEESKSNNNEIFDCVERLFFDADPHKTTVGEIVDKCEKIFGAKFSERREKDIEKYLITLARKHVHL